MAKILQGVEIKDIVNTIKGKGRVIIKDGHESVLELITKEDWNEKTDDPNGIFLFFDLFQIRSVAEPFSDVSLDIIEFASKPTIYHTPINRVLKSGPINEKIVKFAVIRKDFWNRLLFAYSQPLILQYVKSEHFDFETKEYFPLLSAGTKEIFLSPEGDIRILKA